MVGVRVGARARVRVLRVLRAVVHGGPVCQLVVHGELALKLAHLGTLVE